MLRASKAALAAALAISIDATAVLAQDAALGARIAEARCSKCHATGTRGDSPARAAPPFRDLAREPLEMLEAARASGVVAGHDEMPMFEFTKAEVEALIAHIRRLAPPAKR